MVEVVWRCRDLFHIRHSKHSRWWRVYSRRGSFGRGGHDIKRNSRWHDYHRCFRQLYI
ncbi:MAG: hypothetical protein L0922_08175 [Candidatus Mariimomonas ferrooxydans]